MSEFNAHIDMMNRSIKRMRQLSFGDPVTNICAGKDNPLRLGQFVEYITKSRRNRFGIVHTDRFARIRCSNGKFVDTGIDVIYPGHLSESECAELFAPVWQAKFGKSAEIGKAG